ncbi:hypothetical protein ACIJYE_00745 [Candidatus Pelagibacter bacterium nBUS_30]|uniref:hypothetical protein n=1 Tax=Candidatus Pelagibacter bacterium nBUS_30 TaxID=3374191 RepID=UPI003EC015B5
MANILSYFIKKNLKAKKYYIYDKKKINFLDIAKKIKSYSKNKNKINLNFLGKSLKYKIENPTLNNKLFTYTDMFRNLNKIIYEKKL